MTDIKAKAQAFDANVQARDVQGLARTTGNVYEALSVIATRSRQLATDLKHELHQKLEEFATTPETIEEVVENKEQIEISKFYERLPNPVVIATEEYLAGDLHYQYKNRNRRFD